MNFIERHVVLEVGITAPEFIDLLLLKILLHLQQFLEAAVEVQGFVNFIMVGLMLDVENWVVTHDPTNNCQKFSRAPNLKP